MWGGEEIGFIQINVFTNHYKVLKICDWIGDLLEPGLQVDPTLDEPILYQDPNGSHAGCLEHTISYPVRKFRYAVHEANSSRALRWDPWFNKPPLPFADY
ncbi:hypothetical protein Asi02nite_77940 [Asanoa siamensis]|uniref:Uncharacterized protein n=2 Tax=Asanoa siamensis TaxID=926357 RepID=A0ABQ4D439_9ACTN|nr:hypothetical protein Asi02nite_77940 [Asanoa siamensis]